MQEYQEIMSQGMTDSQQNYNEKSIIGKTKLQVALWFQVIWFIYFCHYKHFTESK